MLLSVGALLGWLIVVHELWESRTGGGAAKDTVLYNAATTITLLIAILCGYAVLFALLLTAAALVIDADVFTKNVGHRVDLDDYVTLAWFAASIATVAGALGSGLENADAVRQAAYGHNQAHREHD
jgi:xanthine/uracil permease